MKTFEVAIDLLTHTEENGSYTTPALKLKVEASDYGHADAFGSAITHMMQVSGSDNDHDHYISSVNEVE